MKRILLLFIIVLLISGCNTNIGDALVDFCISKGYETYNEVRNYNYENTSVECASYSYWGFKTDKKAIFDISCIPTEKCLKLNKWGDCKKSNYNYTCVED